MTDEMLDEADLARNRVMVSAIPDSLKRTYFSLLKAVKDAASDGPAERVASKTAEALFLLSVAQIKYAVELDERIEQAIKRANTSQCQDCKAMKRALDEEAAEKAARLAPAPGWRGTLVSALTSPYAGMVAIALVLSPYGQQVLEQIARIFGAAS